MPWPEIILSKWGGRYQNHHKLSVCHHYIVYYLNGTRHIDDIAPDLRETMITEKFDPDVVFIVSDLRFPAFKDVLRAANEQFYIKNVEPHQHLGEIVIENVDPSGFQQFLRFLHFGDLNLTSLNVMPTFDVAQTYQHSVLLASCTDFICKDVQTSNVLEIWDWNMRHQNYQILRTCRGYFIDNAFAVLTETSQFERISRQLLDLILSCDVLNCAEILLFKQTVKWAEARCLESQIEPSPFNQKIMLADLLHLIRLDVSQSLEVTCEFPSNPRANRFAKRRFDNLFVAAEIERTWEEIDGLDDDFICHGFSVILSNPGAHADASERFLMTVESESDVLCQKEFEIKVHDYMAFKDYVFEAPLTMQRHKRHFVTVKFADPSRSRYLARDDSSDQTRPRILRLYD